MNTHLSRRQFIQGLSLTAGALWAAQAPLGLLAQATGETGRPLLMAHFMPWYQAPSVSGEWGWHWTMGAFDPDQTGADGLPQIASHYHPLTGPYDSSDDDVLEYQVLLMKLSGIDGVIVDWYGILDYSDYAADNRSTGKLFEHVKAAGLKFAICYEDQSLKHMIDDGLLAREDAVARGQDVMRYLQDHWFSDDAYLKHDDQPVLLTFGPQYFNGSADWQAMFSVIDPAPALVTLDKHMVLDAVASFPWLPMSGFTLNEAALKAYFRAFYLKARNWEYVVGAAFPAFWDSYQEAGVRASYGYIDPMDGDILRFTLATALRANPDVIQIVTWNDYGEGTIIEPTVEFGSQYLEIIQATARDLIGDSFAFNADDLKLPLRLFHLRQAHAGDAAINTRLDEAASAIIAGDLASADQIVSSLEGA